MRIRYNYQFQINVDFCHSWMNKRKQEEAQHDMRSFLQFRDKFHQFTVHFW